MILPLIDRYGGHLWPVNLLLSYLWLTSFIFSAQDWARGRCSSYSDGFGKCGLKKTVIAFNFIACEHIFKTIWEIGYWYFFSFLPTIQCHCWGYPLPSTSTRENSHANWSCRKKAQDNGFCSGCRVKQECWMYWDRSHYQSTWCRP